jgi:hypothetical protein
MYLLGGHNAMGWLDSMLVYSPSGNRLTDAGQMPFARGYGGAAVIGRSIYIIGGGDGQSWLNTAARYDIDTKEWFQVGAESHNAYRHCSWTAHGASGCAWVEGHIAVIAR